MTNKPHRSVLYVPATNAKALAKAGTLACDTVIVDLEDSVAPEAKAEARDALVAHFANAPASQKETVIRVNALETGWGAADLAAAASCRPDAVLLPKVETADQLRSARAVLDEAGASDAGLWAMIETPLAIVNIKEICAAGSRSDTRLQCLVAGTNDLAKETALAGSRARLTMVEWLAPVAIHAKAFRIDILDGVYNDFRDVDGFAAECREGAERGFDGKTLIHPAQIEVANEAFSPSQKAIEDARAIVAAFDHPDNAGRGVISLKGKMLERLHLEAAQRLLVKAASM
ncbi:CoA ester lyase [Mesorhizobium sp. DCY119]|uniref:HpcH/HpaI aldolase/citrate lyase family protein n=1 Tax=Mesorhizobium sp. DCY119 TaxID=2108445 RepID=UPI000E7132B0|nr:CoA ester lyase [Mesorhizobium sp. DCY119]RJG40868.1 CoA ester lyase [Mesorhizobium sp. DCY119]